MRSVPDFSIEKKVGKKIIAGLDEAGRGPLCGPVVAGAVVFLNYDIEIPVVIRDSKQMSEKQRNTAYDWITNNPNILWAVAECSAAEIDEMNILQASLTAMTRAVSALKCDVEYCLVDGNKMPKGLRGVSVVKGDAKSLSVAAASIIAKVTRDRIMKDLAKKYPQYEWEKNAGYPTQQHLQAIDKYGINEHYRKTYRPIKERIEKMEIRNIQGIDVRSKYVLLRDDFNVQIVDGKITDTFRIDASMPTIKYLIDNGARVVICSHLGRPKGRFNPELSLRPIAEYMNVPFIDDCLKKDFLLDMADGDVVLLENLRFYIGEEENNDSFAKKLASGYDIYVNDAFAVSHRSAASIVGVTKYLPAYAGLLLEKEIINLTKLLNNPAHPLVAYIGGGKVSTKIDVLKKLVLIADKMVIGGAMGTTFNYALGLPVGDSLCEKDMVGTVNEIIKLAVENDCKLFLPLDKGVGKEFDKNAVRENRDADKIKDDDIIMDDGDRTTERNISLLNDAETVLWNGTFGLAEWGKRWGKSSFDFARALAKYTKEGKLESIVGGGDTVAALDACGALDNISYVSTGGGAFLEFIEGRTLPGIVVLEK